MPNKNYEKGRNKEYRICYKLKEQGYDIVQRTAGSHSPIDIIAINKELKQIQFIQAKPNSMSNNKRNQLEQEQEALNGLFSCVFNVI